MPDYTPEQIAYDRGRYDCLLEVHRTILAGHSSEIMHLAVDVAIEAIARKHPQFEILGNRMIEIPTITFHEYDGFVMRYETKERVMVFNLSKIPAVRAIQQSLGMDGHYYEIHLIYPYYHVAIDVPGKYDVDRIMTMWMDSQ